MTPRDVLTEALLRGPGRYSRSGSEQLADRLLLALGDAGFALSQGAAHEERGLDAQADDMCPNCVTPWKCNGPHEYTADGGPAQPGATRETARRSAAGGDQPSSLSRKEDARQRTPLTAEPSPYPWPLDTVYHRGYAAGAAALSQGAAHEERGLDAAEVAAITALADSAYSSSRPKSPMRASANAVYRLLERRRLATPAPSTEPKPK